MWKRPATWIVLALLAVGALTITALRFEEAFPVVALELEVDRSQVLESARERARRAGWGMDGYRSAVAFGLRDPEAKTYVELEAGGRRGWQELVEEGEFHPYVWTVRLFRPGETREARVRFAPDGSVRGFRLLLPEGEPGPSLSPDSARVLAEAAAHGEWDVALDLYRPVSASEEVRPGGRTDHTFVYERPDGEAGEARFRLRITVAGDRPAGVERFVEVPEAFTRRYAEMRSANEALAFFSSLGAGLLYVVLGCGVGLFFLLRGGLLRWRPAAAAALGVSGLLFAADLNRIPLAWMGYDTAVSEASFLVQEVSGALLILLGAAFLLALVFSVGEGLTRRAFGDQPRLWALGSRGAANARPVLGRALGGYLYAALAIPYVVGFYFLATRVLGWWTPAEALVEPDLLATPLPWLSAVATALFAGTNEELLFRAVPLAGAALLGERLGRRRLWIGAALVLQAVIFAAAHANYPQQPAYARLVELLVPSLAFGLIFLRFGLLPAILGHYLFDLAWMSLPLFTSSAPGILVDQAFVVGAGLAPLGVVLGARIRWGARDEVAPEALNRSDMTPLPSPPEPATEEIRRRAEPEPVGHPSPGPALLLPLGAAGLLAWVLALAPGSDAPTLRTSRSEALAMARDTLAGRGAPRDDPWRLLATVEAGRGQAHRYVRNAHGEGTYRELVGSYLAGPRWSVRVARFEGTVEERAEEWAVEVTARGRVARVRHQLPEAAPGDSLSEEEAAGEARAALLRRFAVTAARIELVSAEARQRPARRDWTFTFRDRAIDLGAGQARAEAVVAGSEVVDARLLVHVPEEWRREERSRRSRRGILSLGAGVLLFLLAAAAAGFAVLRWSRHAFPPRVFFTVGAGVFVLLGAETANGFPGILAELSTTQPLGIQLAIVLGGGAFAALLAAGFVGLLAGLGHGWGERRPTSLPGALGAGSALGLALAGVWALVERADPRRLPPWPDFGGADAVLPWLAGAQGALLTLLFGGTLLLVLLAALRRARGTDARRPWTGVALLAASGFGFAGLEAGSTTVYWLVSGAVWTGVVLGLHEASRRWGLALVPAAVAAPLILDRVLEAWVAPYPGSRPGALLAVLAVAGVTGLWTRSLAAPTPGRPGAARR